MMLLHKKDEALRRPGVFACLFLYAVVLLYARFAGLALSSASGKTGSMLFTLGIGVIPLLFSILAGYSLPVVFRIRLPRLREVAGGIVMTIGMFLLVLLFSSVLVFLFPNFNESGREMREKMVGGSLFQALLAVVFLPAICEELFFRGFVLTALASDAKKWVAIFLCGSLFGFMHLDPFQIPFTLAIGIGFSYVAWETRSIFVPVLMHGIHNATVLMMVRGAAVKASEGPDKAIAKFSEIAGANNTVTGVVIAVVFIILLVSIVFAVFCLVLGKRMVCSNASDELSALTGDSAL